MMFSELPLFLFTLLGGAAAGIYMLAACFPKALEDKRQWIIPTIVLALLAIGGVALLFHLGRPERMLKAFRNISAGITQEGYATMAFGIVVFVDFVLSVAKRQAPRVLRWIGAALGLVLVIVMANAYFAIVTNAAMHAWQTFGLFLVAAFAMGATFVCAFCGPKESSANLAKAACAIDALFLVAALLEGIQYGSAGFGMAPFAVSAVCAAIGAVCIYAAQQRGASLAWTAFVLVVVAAALSRYAFYLAI